MNEEFSNALKGFDSVWQRVSGGAARPAPEPEPEYSAGDAGDMERFMRAEAGSAALYREMALQTRGNAASTFLCMAADERRHLRGLQLEYFLLTGDTYASESEKPPPEGLLSRMRNAYIGEGKAERAYKKSAGDASSAELREMYAANAVDEARHRETLREMIKQAMK